MFARTTLCIALLAAGSWNASASDLPTVSKDLLYRAARSYLIARGNHPVAVPDRADEACAGYREICRAYVEAVKCQGADNAQCIFEWRTKSGRPFVVATQGEQLRDVRVTEVRPMTADDR